MTEACGRARHAGWITGDGMGNGLNVVDSQPLRASGREEKPFSPGQLRFDLACLAVLCLALFLATAPFETAWLGDDALHAKSILRSYQAGHLLLSPAIASTFVLQGLIGWGAAAVLGYSPTVLRLLTLLFGSLSLAGLYAMARELGLKRSQPLVLCVVVGLNPLFVRLMNSFMTDVFFLAFVSVAAACLVRGLRSGIAWILVGSVLASASFFVRQFGLVIPLALVVALVADDLRRGHVAPWRYLAAVTVPLLSVVGYDLFAARLGAVTWAQERMVLQQETLGFARHLSIVGLAIGLLSVVANLSVMAAPAILISWAPSCWFLRLWGANRLRSTLVVIVAAALAGYEAVQRHSTLMLGGILPWMGLAMASVVWNAALVVSLVPIALLLVSVCAAVAARRAMPLPSPATVFLVASALGLTLAMLVRPPEFWHDRYLLPIFPLFAAAFLAAGRDDPHAFHWRLIGPIAALGVAAVVVTKAQYDAASIQWREADRLVQAGVASEQVRGNNGWEAWEFWDSCIERQIREKGPDETTLHCWDGLAETEWKIKVTRMLGVSVARQDPGYQYVVRTAFSTYGLPGEVVTMRRVSAAPESAARTRWQS